MLIRSNSQGFKTNWILSTGFRKWVIWELAKTYSSGLSQLGIDSTFTEIPQSRRHVRSFRGYFYMPPASHNVIMHQDIALHMERKGWLNGDSKNLLRYTHHNRDVNDYLKALKFIDFVIVENSRNKDDFVTRGIPSERSTSRARR